MKGLSLASNTASKSEPVLDSEASTTTPSATPPPRPAGKAKGKGRTWRNLFERVLLPLIIGGAVYLVWWGVERLRRVQQQSASLTQQVSRLSTDIELMEGQWPVGKAAEVGQQFDDATAAVFRGAPEVKAWGERLAREALRRALDVQIRFTGTRSSMPGEKAFTIMRARLDIRPAPGVESPHTPFQRLLDFADTLVTQTQRVDLLELRVQGSANSMRRAQAMVELWGVEASEIPVPSPEVEAVPAEDAAAPEGSAVETPVAEGATRETNTPVAVVGGTPPEPSIPEESPASEPPIP
ncbi:MAG: hypothetical protein IT580_10670 [Verrucomicrobiales bacterium]|nr:hypothetical protein [Verrucomicrobiales bacterium]